MRCSMGTAKPSIVASQEPSRAAAVVRIHLLAAKTATGSVMVRIQNVLVVEKWNLSTGVRSVQISLTLPRASIMLALEVVRSPSYTHLTSRSSSDLHMDSKKFGFGCCVIAGPWVLADLESGVWGGNNIGVNPTNTPINSSKFVTAMLKGRPGGWELKGGDAQSGKLKTVFDGPRPPHYDPMVKQVSPRQRAVRFVYLLQVF